MEPLCYIALFAAVVAILYYYGTKGARKLEAAFPGLPGPKPWPFIGNIPDFLKMKGQLHLYFDMNFKKYGRLYAMSFVGAPTLVTTDPEMIKETLVKQFECFHDRPVSLDLSLRSLMNGNVVELCQFRYFAQVKRAVSSIRI